MIRNATKEITKIDVDVLLETLLDRGCKLVVHNDEVNTFEWIIDSLVEICKHSPQQAEQCAYIIHFNGSYAVKTGTEDELKPMREALVDRDIGATIEYD